MPLPWFSVGKEFLDFHVCPKKSRQEPPQPQFSKKSVVSQLDERRNDEHEDVRAQGFSEMVALCDQIFQEMAVIKLLFCVLGGGNLRL